MVSRRDQVERVPHLLSLTRLEVGDPEDLTGAPVAEHVIVTTGAGCPGLARSVRIAARLRTGYASTRSSDSASCGAGSDVLFRPTHERARSPTR